MKHFVFLMTAMLCVSASAVAETDQTPAIDNTDRTGEGGPVGQPGRYQLMVGVSPETGLYFLDTSTGQLWFQGQSGVWRSMDSPVAKAVAKADEDTVQPEVTPSLPESVKLSLPDSGRVEMPMVQRETLPIPGSADTLRVKLGDVTGGQVFVELIGPGGGRVVQRKSVANGDFFSFSIDDEVFYLQIIGMVNNLLGEDICKVVITTYEPGSNEGVEENDKGETEKEEDQKTGEGTGKGQKRKRDKVKKRE